MITHTSERLPLALEPFQGESWIGYVAPLLNTDCTWFRLHFNKRMDSAVLRKFWTFIVACFCQFLKEKDSIGPGPIEPKFPKTMRDIRGVKNARIKFLMFIESGMLNFELSLLRNIDELQKREVLGEVRFYGTLYLFHRKVGIPISLSVYAQLVKKCFTGMMGELAQWLRWRGEYKKSYIQEDMLPLFYPCGVYVNAKKFDRKNQNGMVVLYVKGPSPACLLKRLEELRKCPWLKLYHVNSRGCILAVFWLGKHLTTPLMIRNGRLALVCKLTDEYPDLGFIEAGQRTVRGILMSGDPDTYCRPDRDVKPFYE